jgi:dnd system-associated protein 4
MSDKTYEDSSPGRDYNIQEDKHDLYKELQEDEESPFTEAELNEIFVFAAAYGSRKAGRIPIDGGGRALFSQKTLNDDTHWLLRSIAVAEERTTDVLIDGKLMKQIVEEYANGGITELHNKVFGPGDPLVALSDDVIELSQGHDME